MGLFFYNKNGSIISIGDLPTTNIIEPELLSSLFFIVKSVLKNEKRLNSCQKITTKHENSENSIDRT